MSMTAALIGLTIALAVAFVCGYELRAWLKRRAERRRDGDIGPVDWDRWRKQ